MDAVEYIKERKRMCRAAGMSCDQCPLWKKTMKGEMGCRDYEAENPNENVALVEQWAKEHPKRTKRSEFLEHYPNAAMRKNGTSLCPKAVDDTYTPASGKCEPGGRNCLECMEEYWLAEVEEK